MNQVARHNSPGTRLLLMAALTLALGAPAVYAAEDITGDWDMTMTFNENKAVATLTITKNPDGTLSGRWGGSELSGVKFDGQKLTFTRTLKFQDSDFTSTYAGTVKEGKLTGQWSSDRGEYEASGVKMKPPSPAAGVWDLSYKIGDRDMTAKLAVSPKPDGSLAAKWTTQRGESTISNVQFRDGKLTFDRVSSFNGNEFKSTFEGTVQGDKLTGTTKSDRGEMPVAGTRAGGALIGKWILTSVSDRGTRNSLMTINPDLTGRYEFFFGEIPVKDLKLEGNQVTFTIESTRGDQTFKSDFKGKLEGNVLQGQMTSERGTTEITGKKLPPATGGAAVGSASAIVGTWEFTREGQDGTRRTTTLTIKPDMTGAYKMRDTEAPVTGLKVDGDSVTFKVTMTYNGNEVPMEFKGKVEGGTLKGEFTTSRGTREAVGKKVQ